MTIEEVLKKNVEEIIPTGWNIYEWANKHPDTTIAHALKRVEKIFDFSDAIHAGFSGGKDSTVSANLACLELNLRKLRVKAGIDRDGNSRIDPLDEKWANQRINMAMTDAEVCFSDTNNYTKRFLEKYGPNGLDLITFNWICLDLSWQSGVSFDSGVLISWDEEKKDQWVQQMPTKDELHGFENLNRSNLKTANPVPLASLSEEARWYHIKNDNVFLCRDFDFFGSKEEKDDDLDGCSGNAIEAVGNFGRGETMKTVKKASHEKEQQDDYNLFLAETTWLITNPNKEAIKAELDKRYDLTYDVWTFTEAGPETSNVYNYGNNEPLTDKQIEDRKRVTTALISLRAEESLDRRVILSQGEYSTGQYSNNLGVNVCSPVFDFTTADIWRLLSATDWDVNEVYEKLYEIGVGIGDQRVGSLLNYAAVRQISTVKALEPDLYARINARFQNVEFMSQFSRAGYFKVGKPRDISWDGKNHVKAGFEPEEVKALSDRYENLLTKLNIPFRREGNEFWSADPEFKGKPWHPLKNYMNEHPEMFN